MGTRKRGGTEQDVAGTMPDEPRTASTDRGRASYTVVARRYRPQRFEDVVGQGHVVQALENAIRLNRVTHAYLFSGTRGVGKTSIARIFAKCLNCIHGPTTNPCGECDICKAIAAGQDVDVIEIDGASNNGVEQVRELRQNAGLRPSRSRFKIYYIDEVHMLSTGAFNALLKTLEEPPEHVKFFFATTEPNRIPITVLSRCQRFDFAGIAPEQIIESLTTICVSEHIEADRDALQAVARRAGGSMRDAQSLLEQLLSFGGTRLTAELVHQALGIAPDERVLDLIDALANHDPAKALTLLDGACRTGVQPGELLTGVLDFLRDIMVTAAGAEVDSLAATPSQRQRLRTVADRWPLDSILAAMQILAEARSRLRGSPHGRLIVELALCRISRLENFQELSELIGQLAAIEAGAPSPGGKKKMTEGGEPAAVSVAPRAQPQPARAPAFAAAPSVSAQPREVRPAAQPPRPASSKVEREPLSSDDEPVIATGLAPSPTARPHSGPQSPVAPPAPPQSPTRPIELDAAQAAWRALPEKVGLRLGVLVSCIEPSTIEPPDCIVLAVPNRYDEVADQCELIENFTRISQNLQQLLDRPVRLRFQRNAPDAEEASASPSLRAERVDSVLAHPLVQYAVEIFEARRVRVEYDGDPEAN